MGAGISQRNSQIAVVNGYQEIPGEGSRDVNTHSDDEVPLTDDDSSSLSSSFGPAEERNEISTSPDVFHNEPVTSDEKGESISGLTSYKILTHQVSRAARASVFKKAKRKRSGVTGSGEVPGVSDGRTLNTLFGVFMPCVLAMFSLVLFLRVGTAVGQCGLYQSLVLLCLGELVLLL